MAHKGKPLLRSSALASGLLTQVQLDRADAAIRTARGQSGNTALRIEDAELADYLVEKDILTTYQADQMRAGRSKFNLGPYVITDYIGQGGMGQVFKGVHEVMGRVSAVKVLPTQKCTDDAIASFTREIRTQAQLDHTNLVRAYDAGEDGNAYYLVTEYVPGTDLRRLIRSQGGPLTMQQAASVIMQSAEGLGYAHQQGLLHRDVKPGNILVTPEGIAKVSDLGLSGFMNSDDDPRAGKVVGTPDYLSPEQIRRPTEVGPSSDIYSLGCTLYYAITAKVPFPGGNVGEKTRRHLYDTPWHPRRFNSEISEEFVEIIADMMEKDVDDRIQTAAEVVARLEPWAIEVQSFPGTQMQKSSWLPPPLPTGEEFPDTDLELDLGAGDSSISQASQGTSPISAQETLPSRIPTPPPLTLSYAKRSPMGLRKALAIAIPASLAAGAVVGYLIRGMGQ